MSTQGAGGSTRRVTRASSRGVGSREGSVEDSSAIGDTPGTPARSTRNRARSTPSRETSRDVGNRGSTAYGAKGKAFSGSSISADQANLAPADLLQQEVERAQASQARATRQGSQLPPVLEESNAESEHGSDGGSRSPSADQTNQRANYVAQGLEDNARTNPVGADAQRDGNTVYPTIVEDSSLVERTFWTGITDRVGLWMNHAADWDHRLVNPLRRAGAARGMRGFEQDWEGTEFGMTYPHSLAWTSKVVLGLLLVVFVLLLDLYRGPLLGQKYDLLKGRMNTAPQFLGSQTSGHVQGRLSALERLADHIASRNRADNDFAHEFQYINWFSPGLGARVVPRLSSPGHAAACKVMSSHDLGWWDSRIAKMLGVGSKCIANAPSVALRPWFDVDDRFCAPPNRGKLQLTVDLSREVAPTELIVEYPKDAVPQKGNAPREIELWADVRTLFTRENVGLAYDGSNVLEESQIHRELDSHVALPESFVLIGRWKYDLHSRYHIQTFRIPADLKALGVKSKRLTVRVNTNWGDSAATCLYRIRLHGHDMSDKMEFLMDPLPSAASG